MNSDVERMFGRRRRASRRGAAWGLLACAAVAAGSLQGQTAGERAVVKREWELAPADHANGADVSWSQCTDTVQDKTRYAAEISVTAEKLDSLGRVVDFSVIEDAVKPGEPLNSDMHGFLSKITSSARLMQKIIEDFLVIKIFCICAKFEIHVLGYSSHADKKLSWRWG